jgi:hypothetical protein
VINITRIMPSGAGDGLSRLSHRDQSSKLQNKLRAQLSRPTTRISENLNYLPRSLNTKRPGRAGSRTKSWEEAWQSNTAIGDSQEALRRIPPRMSDDEFE